MALRLAGVAMCSAILFGLTASAGAQDISGSIAGVVEDTTGAALPGVTVEAASPALIEQVRTAVTDGRGLYRILDLRPGVYSVTFTLPGFRTFVREGIELTTSFTATVNAEMSVGGIEETVTVTGAAPLVDVQNVTSQAVLQREQLDILPTGKAVMGYAAMTVGISVGGRPDLGARDVGGVFNEGTVGLVAHGSRVQDQLSLLNGLNVGNFSQGTAGGGLGRHVYINHAGTEEVVVTTIGFAEYETAGVVVNAIPKEGVRRPQFSWTRIRGESDVTGGRVHGSVEEGEGSRVGADGGSPEGDRSRRRRGGGGVGGLGARAAVEREPETGRGVASAARRVAGHGLA